jgi:hypothetical protein
MEQLGSHWTDFYEIWYLSIFRKSVLKIQVSLKSNRNKRYFTWKPIYIFGCISLVSSWHERCLGQEGVEKIAINILCSVTFFSRIVPFMRMWKNYVRPDRSQTTILLMRIARWILKSTIRHLEYVILIAFPLRHWLHERTSVVGYTYIACLATLETLKNPNVFSSNWKWTDTSSKHPLCLSQHSHHPMSFEGVRQSMVSRVNAFSVRWRALWASAVNCDDTQQEFSSN